MLMNVSQFESGFEAFSEPDSVLTTTWTIKIS